MDGLARLLNPRTLAVIGGRECERVVEQCDKLGFDGAIWPVHPKRDEMRGRTCFRSVDDLPKPPDAAYVAVNRERSVDIVAALARRGCGGAVCYASGFAEADDENAGSQDLQDRLVEAAGDMPIIGPNCYGFINALDGVALWPDQHGATACEDGVAIITQSSNIAINLTMQKRGLPVAMVMTAGNQAQLGLSDIARHLIENERITALGLHIEGLDDVRAFEALSVRARELGKPIVAIKVGRSDQARVAAMTHTASLAGSTVAHDALFLRLGVAQVHSLDTFLETLKILHVHGALPAGEILSLSCSGGEAALMADAVTNSQDLHFRPYTLEEAAGVKAQLGDIVTVANPLDYHTFIWGDWPAMTRMFEAAFAPPFDLALLVMDFPRADRCDDADWRGATDSFIAAVRQTGTRAAVVATLPETLPEHLAADLMKKGIVPFCTIDAAMAATAAAVAIGQAWRKPVPLPLLGTPMPVAQSSKDEGGATKGTTSILDEYQAKAELAARGLVVPKSAVIENGRNVETACTSLTPPFALKALGIAHKSDVGGVALDLQTTTDVERAMEGMADLTDRFLLEAMAPRPLVEIIVGVTRDPVVGLMLTIGAGGVLAELVEDAATLLLPVSQRDIRDALSGSKTGKLLDGYRDSEAADINALVANIICIANYAVAHADVLEELDVNPLFATQFGSIAVDALVIKRKPT